jgi:hypothetical protein
MGEVLELEHGPILLLRVIHLVDKRNAMWAPI